MQYAIGVAPDSSRWLSDMSECTNKVRLQHTLREHEPTRAPKHPLFVALRGMKVNPTHFNDRSILRSISRVSDGAGIQQTLL